MQLEVSAAELSEASSSDEMRGERRRRHLEQEMEMEEGVGENQNTPLIASDASNDDREEKSYEALLNHIGFGKFHVLLLLVCGWANASGIGMLLC